MEDGLKAKLITEKNPLLKAALEYLLIYKWSIIPLNGKRPYQEWAEFQTRLPTEQELRNWWKQWPKANIGVVCGKVSGLVVLDLDGESGRKSFAKKGHAPITIAAYTGGDGSHYYYLHPGREVRNFAKKEPGLDFRGDGGYVVAPPSIHPETKVAYEWTLPPEQEELYPCPDWLMDMLGEKRLPKRLGGNSSSLVKTLQGLPAGKRDDGIFRYACRLRTLGMSKEEAEVLICTAANNCTPSFPRDQALVKIDQAWKYDGPEISAPEEITSENVFEKPSLILLAKLKKTDVGAYAKVKQGLKGKINLNDLEKAVNDQIAKNQGMYVVKKENPSDLSAILPDIPLTGLSVPTDWNVSQKGICRIIFKKEVAEKIYASAVPVILTKRLKNIDTAEEKVELAYYRDRKWHCIISDRATVFNSRSLIQLANRGLLVSSESARHLIRYLDDLERENLDNLPLRKSVSHMGWIGKKEFFPGVEGEVVLDIEEGGFASILSGYREIGTLEKWLEMIEPLRGKCPIARFMIAAAFATPLLLPLKQRVSIIHSWGGSRGGKTAALKAALSVWGDPEITMASFNATKVGLEATAALYNDLPLGIDEKQVVADKQGFVESLVYMLGLGKGKIKGKKNGGIRETGYWRTIGISTGEQPISSESSTAGIKTRVLEIYGRPIPDEKLAGSLHSAVRDNCGHAGPEFVRWLMNFMSEYPEQVTEDFKEWKKLLEEEHPQKISSHIATITTICLADYYVSKCIFEQREDVIRPEIMEMAAFIIRNLESSEEADEGVRAMEYFQSWYGVNYESFTISYIKERYGYENNGVLYVFPTIFERAMLEGKFNSSQILRNWGEKDWILKEKRKNEEKARLKVRKSFESGKSGTFIAINLKTAFSKLLDEEDISQEEIPF